MTIAWTTYDFCPKGYKSISLVASVVKGAITLDCPNSHAHATTDLNDWDKPRSKLNLPVSSSCNDKTYTATLKDIPRSRVAMDLKMNNKPGVDSISLDYTVKYTCAGTTKEITVPIYLTHRRLGQDYPNSYGDVFTSITKTYTGTTTQTKTLPEPNTNADRTITVEIDVPTSATTITSTWTGTETTTVTRTASEGGIDTVIIEVPTPATTLTSTWTGTETTTVTQTASEGGTNTVIVVKPTTFSETTLFSTGTGTSEYTITETAASSGGTNTVIVVKPTTFSETTLYSTGTGTSEYTITETAASSGGTNTVIVVKPTSLQMTFSLGLYWNSSSTVVPNNPTASDDTTNTVLTTTTIPGTIVVTSTAPCEECAQPTSTSGGFANSHLSQVGPSATSGREPIISSITSGEHGESACTDCEYGASSTLVSSKTQARDDSGTVSSGSPGHGAYPTASSKGAFTLTSSLALSSSATVLPSVTVVTPYEGAASQQRLAWALALGVLLYFV